MANFTPVWKPYESANKRQRTHLGNFRIECFDLPHNGCDNRGFIIESDGQKICYMTDMEYCPYDLSTKKINTMIIELNYQEDMIGDLDEHRKHIVLGHCSETTTIEILKNNEKHLNNVILIHMSNSGYLNRNLAMERIKKEIPEYIKVYWAKAGETYDISTIPF